MKCPTCERKGLKSTVADPGVSTSTCMAFSPGYYNEDGKYVRAVDPNTTTAHYGCSHGHAFTVSTRAGRTTITESPGSLAQENGT